MVEFDNVPKQRGPLEHDRQPGTGEIAGQTGSLRTEQSRAVTALPNRILRGSPQSMQPAANRDTNNCQTIINLNKFSAIRRRKESPRGLHDSWDNGNAV
jgi:hypothetical protein